MTFWLMKSEPSVYSWQQLVTDKETGWSGVRNHQANNFMKAMKIGDRAFFYHSNEGKEIVGIMKIKGLWKPDPADKDGKFGMVMVAPLKEMKKPVGLEWIKTAPALAGMMFLRQGRLSVSAVTDAEARVILAQAGM